MPLAPAFMALLGGPEHRFEIVNPLYLQLIGERELVGRTVAQALPETVEQGFVALLDRVYVTGESCAWCGQVRDSKIGSYLYRFGWDDDQGSRGSMQDSRLFCSRECRETFNS
mgnify:CR=1 FL=1